MNGSFFNKTAQTKQENEIQFLNNRLNEIENLVFAHRKEKLDEYTKSILVAHLAENKKNLNEIKDHLSQKVAGMATNNYAGTLKPLPAFMLRWGWTLTGSAVLGILVAAWWLFDIQAKYEIVQQKTPKQELIDRVVKYDSLTNRLYLNDKDCKIAYTQKGKTFSVFINDTLTRIK